MEGVEILAVGEQAIYGGFGWWPAIIIGLGVGIISAIAVYRDTDRVVGSICFGILLCIPTGSIAGAIGAPVVDYIPTYKITIADTVNFNEFTEKYDIIEQDGKIYTVKEREEN